MIKPTKELRFCPMCGTEIQADNFYESLNPHHGFIVDANGNVLHKGRLMYCKTHCDKINQELKEKYHDDMKALWFTCATMDVPFVMDVYKKFSENKQNQIKERENRINKVNGKKQFTPKEMVEFINNYKDFAHYYDLLKNKCKPNIKQDWSSFASGTDVDWKQLSVEIDTSQVTNDEKTKYLLDWGKQSDMDAYVFLDYTYDELTKGKALTPVQEMTYRDLCLARLTKRNLDNQDTPSQDDIKKVQDQILTLMKTLKIDNFDEAKKKSVIDRLIETRAWEIENKKPAELLDKNMYKDFFGLGSNWLKHVLHATRNLIAGTKEFPNVTKDDWNDYE